MRSPAPFIYLQESLVGRPCPLHVADALLHRGHLLLQTGLLGQQPLQITLRAKKCGKLSVVPSAFPNCLHGGHLLLQAGLLREQLLQIILQQQLLETGSVPHASGKLQRCIGEVLQAQQSVHMSYVLFCAVLFLASHQLLSCVPVPVTVAYFTPMSSPFGPQDVITSVLMPLLSVACTAASRLCLASSSLGH